MREEALEHPSATSPPSLKKSRLLKSVITLSLFYWLLGWLSYSFLLPTGVSDLMSQVPSWFEAVFGGSQFSKPPEEANFLEAAAFQWAGIRIWSVPVLGIWMFALCLGVIIAYGIFRMKDYTIHDRAKARGSFRGAAITKGSLPMPCVLKHSVVEPKRIKLEGLKLTTEETAFLGEILGMLRDRPDAYSGAGHGVGLYEHSMSVIERALNHDECDVNLVLAAAAHDLGKLTSFRQNSAGEWESFKLHAQESARLMAGMDTWWRLPEMQREMIRLACKYDHNPKELPILSSGQMMENVKHLIHRLREIDGAQTAAEKEKVKESYGDLSHYIFELFKNNLDRLMFSTTLTPKGAITVGQKRGSQLVLFEPMLREKLTEMIDLDLWASLGGEYRSKGKLHEFTVNLIRGLDRAGWLVKTLDVVTEKGREKAGKLTAPAENALWYGFSGKMALNGVIVVEVPDEFTSALPKTDCAHEICFYAYHKGLGSKEIAKEAVLSIKRVGEAAAVATPEDEETEGAEKSVEESAVAAAPEEASSNDSMQTMEGDEAVSAALADDDEAQALAEAPAPWEEAQSEVAAPSPPELQQAPPETPGTDATEPASATADKPSPDSIPAGGATSKSQSKPPQQSGGQGHKQGPNGQAPRHQGKNRHGGHKGGQPHQQRPGGSKPSSGAPQPQAAKEAKPSIAELRKDTRGSKHKAALAGILGQEGNRFEQKNHKYRDRPDGFGTGISPQMTSKFFKE